MTALPPLATLPLLPVAGARAVRCPDCRARVWVPTNWSMFESADRVARERRLALVTHATEMPILHPTVLPLHHSLAVRHGL